MRPPRSEPAPLTRTRCARLGPAQRRGAWMSLATPNARRKVQTMHPLTLAGRSLSTLLLGSALLIGANAPAAAETVLRVVPSADLRILDPVAVTVNLTRIHG